MSHACFIIAGVLAGILVFRLGYHVGQRRLAFTLVLGNLAVAAILAKALREIAAGNPAAAAAAIRPLVDSAARAFEAMRARIPPKLLRETNADRLHADLTSVPSEPPAKS